MLSIIIVLIGLLSLTWLPLAQFPRIAPPNVNVTCNYPGADAQVVATAVAAPIEEEVNGVEGMMYMSSQCNNDGTYNLAVAFNPSIPLNMAQVLVQNRVNLALPRLPDVIKQTGVQTRKRSPDILLVAVIYSPGGRHDQLYLSNFALTKLKDELARVEGVGDCFLFGQRDYSMRIWVDPDKLASRNMSITDVVQALRAQNAQIATGQIGQPPTSTGQPLQLTLDVTGRLKEPTQFENIVVKSTSDGHMVRIKDIGRVELGAKNIDINQLMDGMPCCGLALFQLPEANALETAERCLAKLNELKKTFPPDVDFDIAFDTTPYTRESIYEVFKTLRDAIILVALVVLVFLQNWRSAIIPLIAVPVAIVGTFAVMAALGFSLNNLTLFGLVLAIGIVVDDAIVVVEAVEHHIETGLKPRDATILAMQQVSGPVVAVGLVLTAVFVPCAFISGITGMLFRQFALTIAVSTIISAFNSLTLSPALTALLLRPLHHDKSDAPPLPRLAFPPLLGLAGWLWLSPWQHLGWTWLLAHTAPGLAEWLKLVPDGAVTAMASAEGALLGWLVSGPLNRLMAWAFRNFNAGFDHMRNGYVAAVGRLLRVSAVVLVLYVVLVSLTAYGFINTPKGFIPEQDMGRMYASIQLPDSASLERTMDVLKRATVVMKKHSDTIEHITAPGGVSFMMGVYGSNYGTMFIGMKEYAQRRDPSQSSFVVANALQKELNEAIPEASIKVMGPSPVPGVGRAGGFAFVLEDREDLGPAVLQEQVENLVAKAQKQPGLERVFTVYRANVPQLKIEPNKSACEMRGVDMGEFISTLSIYQGSLYVNDFNLFGRTWQVNVQAADRFRADASTISRFKARNRQGNMVPLGAVSSIHPITGPLVFNRYNRYSSATIMGATAKNLSSSEGINLMANLADDELPRSMGYEWTDMSYLEVTAGNTAMGIFVASVIAAFLVLAAQYESWSLPLAVILVVPLCLLSAILGVRIRGTDINIFTQIGFVVLVGLTSKDTILIVEFAKKQREQGESAAEAAKSACRLRLRPIIMTSMAFVLGVSPLMLSRGAGAEMRQALGTAVFSGMLGVTFFGIFLTPVFFYVINRLGEAPEANTPFLRELHQASQAILALPRRAVTTFYRRRKS